MPATTLFDRLKAACAEEWRAYTEHAFVRALGDGTLPEASFRRYLGQDYLFLIHFARAYALAAYKSETLDDIRQAARGLSAIIDMEMGLHVEFCAAWGLDEAAMQALPEAEETMAYTRYVLEKGVSGDLLDLHVALAPCIVGYAEIGAALARVPTVPLVDNPYRAWIDTYSDPGFGEEVEAVIAITDSTAAAATEDQRARMLDAFKRSTQYEWMFWDSAYRLETWPVSV